MTKRGKRINDYRAHETGEWICNICERRLPVESFSIRHSKDKYNKRPRYACLECRAIKWQEKLEQSRKAVINHLGGKCTNCSIDDPKVLQIDHIAGGGSIVQKRNRVSWYKSILKNEQNNDLQLLCANCNWIKKYDNGEKRIRKWNLSKRLSTVLQD